MGLFSKVPAPKPRPVMILKVGRRQDRFTQDVVGESFHQDAISTIAVSVKARLDEQLRAESAGIPYEMIDDDAFLAVAARLVPEPSNQHDRNAVRVDLIDPKTRRQSAVGYLPRADAALITGALQRLARENLVVQCDAVITSAQGNRRQKDSMFGVKLRLPVADDLAAIATDPSRRPVAIASSSPVAHLPTPKQWTPDEEGWYPDPEGRHELRFWTGAQWTEHVCDDYVHTTDPLTG
jgi:hypothetical protein